jgi:hypothetical protein
MAITAYGTHVYAREDGSVVIVPGEVPYEPKPGERQIAEVINVHLEMNCGEVTRAIIECYPRQDTILFAQRMELRFKESFDDRSRKISFVRFDDGKTWYPEDSEHDRDLLYKFLNVTSDLPEIVDPPNNGRPRKIEGEIARAMNYTQAEPTKLDPKECTTAEPEETK